MNRGKTLLAVLIIFIIECTLFFWLKEISTTDIERYAYLTRYSARISFIIIISLLFLNGVKGLHHIFRNEKSLKVFKLLVILLTVNHLIHLYFVYINFEINEWSLVRVKSVFGFIGYLSIVIMPFYLRNKEALSRPVYRNTYIYLFILGMICFVKYLGRVFDQKFIASPDQIIYVFMLVLALTLGLNIYRMIIDNRELKKPKEQGSL